MMPKRLASAHGTSRTAMVQSALLLDVELQHGVIVHLVDVVAAEDQHVIGVELLDEMAMFW